MTTDTITRTWADIEARTTRPLARLLHGLYGASPDYAHDLLELTNRLGATIPTQPPRNCIRRLGERRHTCSHNPTLRDDPGWIVDHGVWLRWPDRGPWALLSQNYGPLVDRDGFLERHGITAVDLGPAPYGYGTTGYLLTGTCAPTIPRGYPR